MRIIDYAIPGNHLQLIVEADDLESLARAMQGLAKRLDALAGRRGAVFVDHSNVLRSRREAARAQLPAPHARVRCEGSVGPDDDVPARPRTWLLRIGWRIDELPRSGPSG